MYGLLVVQVYDQMQHSCAASYSPLSVPCTPRQEAIFPLLHMPEKEKDKARPLTLYADRMNVGLKGMHAAAYTLWSEYRFSSINVVRHRF